MELICFRGLNCFHACIINAARHLGIDYRPALASLWSETDFSYDALFQMYTSQRLLENMSSLGLTLRNMPCATPEATNHSYAQLPASTWIIGGMDAFFMPWSEFYHTLHGLHYFFARVEPDDTLCCFDPTFSQQNIRVATDTLLPHLFDLRSLQKGEPMPLPIDALQEAHKALTALPELKQKLLAEVPACADQTRDTTSSLAAYANALYTNRCLYAHCLESMEEGLCTVKEIFSQSFFNSWMAISNGLRKASLIPDPHETLSRVCDEIARLLDLEIAAASRSCLR